MTSDQQINVVVLRDVREARIKQKIDGLLSRFQIDPQERADLVDAIARKVMDDE